MVLVLPTMDGNEEGWSKFAYQLAESSHETQHVVYITPVEDAPVNNGPATLVIGANDLDEVAVKAVP